MTIEGGRVRCTITIKDNTQTVPPLVDPSSLTVSYGLVDSTTPTVKVYGVDNEVVRESVGVFHIDLTCGTQGRWATLWVAQGTYVGALAQYWTVTRRPF